jgi:hypothetical protein
MTITGSIALSIMHSNFVGFSESFRS